MRDGGRRGGAPVDYRFLEVNPRFEEMTGLVDPVGRTALELVPDLEPVWVATYARSAFGGEVLRFEQGSEAMGRWFEVFAMPVEPRGQFALVFRDQTARRREEEAARRRQVRAELVAEVLSELERVADPDEQLTRLLALLVPALGDEAAFETADGDAAARAATPSPRRLVVPFRAGGDRHGALVVHRRHPSRFDVDAEDVASLQEIADRAEVVMASARLRREEHQISVRLQRALLPERLVWHPNVVVEARYHAAARCCRWAATGTTRSRGPAAGWPSWWAMWSATTSTQPPPWAACGPPRRRWRGARARAPPRCSRRWSAVPTRPTAPTS